MHLSLTTTSLSDVCFLALIEECWMGAGFTVILLLMIVSGYYDAKYRRAVQARYPEKAREYGFPRDSWYNGFRALPSLFIEGDIEDEDIVFYRRRAKRTFVGIVVSGFLIFGVLVGIEVIKAYLHAR